MRLPTRDFFYTSEIRDGMRNAFGKKLPRNHQILFLPHCFVWLVTPRCRPLLLKSWFDFRPSPPFNWSHVLSESLCHDLQKFKCIDELIESNSLNASLFFKILYIYIHRILRCFFGNFGTLPYLDQGAWSFGVGQRFLISTSIELSRLGIRTLWHGHGLAWITQCQSGSKGPCWRSPCCECHTHLEIKIDFEPYEMTTDTRILVYILKNDTKIAGSRYLIHVAQCHLILNRCIPPVQLPQSFGWADPSVFHLQRQRNPSSQLRFIQKGKLEDQKWTSGGPGRTGVSGKCRKFTWLPWRALPYSHDGSPTTRRQVVRAAKIIDALPKVPRRCGSNSPSLPMLRTPRQDAWGCPEARKSKTCKDTFGVPFPARTSLLVSFCQVTKEEFPQKCLGKTHGKPCVTTPAPAIKLALHWRGKGIGFIFMNGNAELLQLQLLRKLMCGLESKNVHLISWMQHQNSCRLGDYSA